MQIIMAGVPGGGSPGECKRERELDALWNKRLHSYFHLAITKGKIMKKNKIDLFLDSGAFSAWSQNVVIDIDDYAAFIKQHQKAITVYANLDVIGSAEQTYANQKKLERRRLSPLPVFHYGEDEKWLRRYLKEGYGYICVGGMVGRPKKELVSWLDSLWAKYFCAPNGEAQIQVHGFGLTSFFLLLRYPWYSVDSTSWVVTGRNGSVFVPIYRNGDWAYNKPPLKIPVSFRSPKKTNNAGDHFTTLPAKQQEIILAYFQQQGMKIGKSIFEERPADSDLKENERWAESKVKGASKRLVEIIKEEGLGNRYQLRDELNIQYYLDLEKYLTDNPIRFKPATQFGFTL